MGLTIAGYCQISVDTELDRDNTNIENQKEIIQQYVERNFPYAHLRIIAIGDGIDYPTKDDWMLIQFKFLMNEMPVTDTSKK